MLCESPTGYLSDFIVYTAADIVYPETSITLPKPFENYSNLSKIVLNLLEGFYNAGYSLSLALVSIHHQNYCECIFLKIRLIHMEH